MFRHGLELFWSSRGLPWGGFGLADDESAAANRVDSLALAEAESGRGADSANFATIGIETTGRVGKIFDDNRVVFFYDCFKLLGVERETESILSDDNRPRLGFCSDEVIFGVFWRAGSIAGAWKSGARRAITTIVAQRKRFVKSVEVILEGFWVDVGVDGDTAGGLDGADDGDAG